MNQPVWFALLVGGFRVAKSGNVTRVFVVAVTTVHLVLSWLTGKVAILRSSLAVVGVTDLSFLVTILESGEELEADEFVEPASCRRKGFQVIVVEGSGWRIVDYLEEGVVEGDVCVFSDTAIRKILAFEDDSVAVVALLDATCFSFSGGVRKLDGAEDAGVLVQGLLDGVCVSAKAKFLSDLVEAAEMDYTRNRAGKSVNFPINDKFIELVGELTRRSIFLVGRDFPVEIDLSPVGGAMDDSYLVRALLGKGVYREF